MKKTFTKMAYSLIALAPFFSPQLMADEAEIAQLREIAPSEAIEVAIYRREETVPLLPLLNTWVANSFGPFPYLYAPREDQIISTTDMVFVNEKNSLVITAKKEGRVVAIATGSALDSFYLSRYFEPELIPSMKEKGYEPSEYFYVAYFVEAPEFRNDLSVIESVYNALVQFAKEIGKTQLTYMDILRGEAHPLRPAIFSSPEPWGTAITGFTPMDLFSHQTWPTYQTDGTIADQEHTLQFFSKSI